MKFLLGNKLGMTQIFAKGAALSVTVFEIKPSVIAQVRTVEKDGYDALQLGYGHKNKINKPEKGHVKALGPFAVLKEFRTDASLGKNVGDTLDVSLFQEGDKVKISAVSKAKGFQGVVKRHGFGGGPASHGQKHSMREAGSIGATWPQRVIKGTRMAGRMGGVRKTIAGLRVVKVDIANNMLAVSGSVPGRRGALIEIRGV